VTLTPKNIKSTLKHMLRWHYHYETTLWPWPRYHLVFQICFIYLQDHYQLYQRQGTPREGSGTGLETQGLPIWNINYVTGNKLKFTWQDNKIVFKIDIKCMLVCEMRYCNKWTNNNNTNNDNNNNN